MSSDIYTKRPRKPPQGGGSKFRFLCLAYIILMIFAFWWYKAGKVNELIERLYFKGSAPYTGKARQLLDLGLIEPGQWF